jgi:hypothetical protein
MKYFKTFDHGYVGISYYMLTFPEAKIGIFYHTIQTNIKSITHFVKSPFFEFVKILYF